MQQHFIQINQREIHVRTWNLAAKETVFCWHGLTRNSADFLALGEHLAKQGVAVIAPDALGRGLSQWAIKPAKEYTFANYSAQARAIMAHFKRKQVHWLGCDMGGLLGIVLASDRASAGSIASLSLNDIGPEVPVEAAKTLIEQAQKRQRFSRFSDLINQLHDGNFSVSRSVHWQRLYEASVRRLTTGSFALNYDENIVSHSNSSTINLWNRFRELTLPLMLMHGSESQVLTADIVKKMRSIQPALTVNHYLGSGHTPNLFNRSYCGDIAKFVNHVLTQRQQVEKEMST